MGLLNKIKNALFEEEYVEVEEKPKKVKKEKPKENIEHTKEKPIAKKVILPERKEDKIEELHEEELIDEDFEIKPNLNNNRVNDEVESDEDFHNTFKMMDDNDFKVDEEVVDVEYDEPEIVKVLENDESFNNEVVDESDKYYVEKNEYKPPVEERKLYGGEDNTIKVHEYGGYERKEEKSYFKPSPIISPIYGVLDKNYKKEDVVSKKDVRLSSSYARGRVSVDDVRNKAYGQLSDDIAREMGDDKEEIKFEVEKTTDEMLVDLSDEKEKPAVKEVTVGDAVEYFQDLGLEYNVDYVDATKEKPKRRVKEEIVEEETPAIKEEATKVTRKREVIINDYDEDKQNVMEIEEKEVSTGDNELDNIVDADDNLFDLIDSMYQENE